MVSVAGGSAFGNGRLARAELPDSLKRSGALRCALPERLRSHTDGEVITFGVLLPDLASLLGMKLHARRVRQVDRDAVDLWTCLELLAAAGEIAMFADRDFDEIRSQLATEFSDIGPATSVVTAGVTDVEATRRRTRLRGLIRAIG